VLKPENPAVAAAEAKYLVHRAGNLVVVVAVEEMH
jgi:hypothetical protein